MLKSQSKGKDDIQKIPKPNESYFKVELSDNKIGINKEQNDADNKEIEEIVE